MLASCQTPRPVTTTVTKTAVTPTTQCGVYAAITLSHDDQLTRETKKSIVDHNNIYWCMCADKRPPDFDLNVCKA